MQSDFRVESTRGGMVESVHRVSLAVVDASGRLLAETGDPALVTFWRSAAKPFQAMPLLLDGAAARFGFDQRELALACASHSSEPIHLEVVDGMLKKVGLTEKALACGTHPPLSPVIAELVLRHSMGMTPRWSNCSGKHTGMLALALTHGWPTAGYQDAAHPVQGRILQEVERWTDLSASQMRFGVDGCTVVCYGLPLRAMALAYARFGASTEPAAVTLRTAMAAHPELVAGLGRLCTDVGQATRGAVIAKVGADGIYCATLPAAGIGIALKVEDGDMRSSAPALLGVIRQLVERGLVALDWGALPPAALRHAALPTVNTRGTVTGTLAVAGTMRFLA